MTIRTLTGTHRAVTFKDVLDLVDAALDERKGDTIHLRGSAHGRFIVGGMAPAIRIPHHQVRHPATVKFVLDRINADLRTFVRAETVGSWRDITTGNVYFDLGTTHERRDDAVHLAGLRGERAIYDSHDDQVEWVK